MTYCVTFVTRALGGKFRRSLCDSLLDQLYIHPQGHTQVMSHSPTLSNSSESIPKKRKAMGSGDLSMATSSQQQPHIPKRGARACTSCRKGKNRCEGEVRPVFLAVTFTHRGPSIPFPARLFINRLLVVDAKPAVPLAFSKSQSEKMYKGPQQVSSMPFLVFYHRLYDSSFYHRRISRLEGQYLVHPATFLVLPLDLYHLVISGHAKSDDWHAIFSRQNLISSPNSKRYRSASSALHPHGSSS